MLKSIQAAYVYAGKEGVKGEKGLELGEAAEKIALGRAESLGGMAGEDLIRMATIYPKALRKSMEAQFRLATADIAGQPGYEKDIKTAKGRIKLLLREAEKIDIKAELEKRPWAEAMVQLNSLKDAVGESIAGPMKTLTKLFTGLVETIKAIPGGAALIGWTAIAFGAVSAISLLNSIITPTIALMNALAAATTRESLAKVWNRAVTLLSIPVRATAAAAIVAETGAAEAATVANTAMGASLWTALAPLLLILVPLIALGAILYAVEQKTHIFSKALKELGRTQMARDILGWFQGLGRWMNETIRSIDAFYKQIKESGALRIIFDFLFAPLAKFLPIIADILKNLLSGQSFLNSLFQGGLAIWKKVSDFLSWLYETLKNLWSWLMKAIPGAEKSVAQKDLQAKLGTGFEYAPSRAGVPYLKIKKTGKEISASELSELIGPNAWPGGETEAYGYVPPMTRRQWIQIFGSAGGTAKGAYGRYESAPGFWEDLAAKIAEAVKGALLSLPDSIAGAISGSLKENLGIELDLSPIKTLGGRLESILEALNSAIRTLSGILDRLFPGAGGPEQLGGEEKEQMQKLLREKGIKLHTTRLGGKEFYEYEKGEKLLSDEELEALGLKRHGEGGAVYPLGTGKSTTSVVNPAENIPNPPAVPFPMPSKATGGGSGGTGGGAGEKPGFNTPEFHEAAIISPEQAARDLGLDPNAVYEHASGIKQSGRELALRTAEWGTEILKDWTGPGIDAEGKTAPIREEEQRIAGEKAKTGALVSDGGSGGGKDDDSTTQDGGGSWWGTEVALGTPSVYGEGEAPDARTSDEPVYSFQAGATFRRGGLISAEVHPPEEIIPQAIAQKGPGPISRAIEMLQLRGIRSAEKSPITNNRIYIQGAQIRIDKVASDIDINRLLNLVDKQTRESVKNALAQRRT